MTAAAAIRETRSEALARWERQGWLDADCLGCVEFFVFPGMPWDCFAPRHVASDRCESGKRAHCSCSLCW